MMRRREMLLHMAILNGWVGTDFIVPSNCTKADQIKNLLAPYISTHKRALFFTDIQPADISNLVQNQFCGAILYNGFEYSLWSRFRTTSYQNNTSFPPNDYWISTYDMSLTAGQKVFVFYDPES